MARADQNHTWGWLYRSKVRQQSLKYRLLLRIGFLFIIIWMAATLSTKYLVKAGSRNFLKQHVQHSAKNWIAILSSQPLESISLPEDSKQFLIGWINNEIVISQNPLQMPQPTETKTYIHEKNNVKWLISTKCNGNACVAVGFRDLERLYAARRLVALVSLPLLIVLFVTAIGVYYAVRSGLRPLNQLAAQVSCSSVDKLEIICEKKPVEELYPLINAINQLITNLKKQLLEERKFLDTCAHELRTPVTALVAQIHSSHFDSKQVNTQLASIELSALRTIRVANQLLNLAKNNSRHQSLESKQVFNLCELTRFIISDLINTKGQCDIQLNGDENIMVYADPLAIEMAIQNIIENAFRHGSNNESKKDTIIITCEHKNDDVFISVEDNGSGVSEMYRDRLLESFYRVPGTRADGAGLGLSIVKEVVGHYSGEVIVEQSKVLGGVKITLKISNIVV